MSKTDKTGMRCVLPVWTRLLLALLVLSISIHFAFEDISLSSNQNRCSAINSFQSEISHQDDIAQIPDIPAQIASIVFTQLNPPYLTLRVDSIFPRFDPPKL